ncbi:MAG: hypothetical protein FWB81_05300 [Cystobacterineae bacterium]|nr:hypothetical protein [Cystobacterineae bacterium]
MTVATVEVATQAVVATPRQWGITPKLANLKSQWEKARAMVARRVEARRLLDLVLCCHWRCPLGFAFVSC